MTYNTWMIDQIEVETSGLFTTHHHFQSETEKLGKLTCPAFGQQATFQASDGRTLGMRKTSWLSNSYELLEGETMCGTASPRKLLSRDILVTYEEANYLLRPERLLRRGWFLLNAEGATLLEIQPRGLFKQGAFLYPRQVLDLDLVVFA